MRGSLIAVVIVGVLGVGKKLLVFADVVACSSSFLRSMLYRFLNVFAFLYSSGESLLKKEESIPG